MNCECECECNATTSVGGGGLHIATIGISKFNFDSVYDDYEIERVERKPLHALEGDLATFSGEAHTLTVRF